MLFKNITTMPRAKQLMAAGLHASSVDPWMAVLCADYSLSRCTDLDATAAFARQEQFGSWRERRCTQLDRLYELARSAPDVTVVIDHFGGPVGVGPHADRSNEVMTHWRTALSKLAVLPNTRMKIGGAGIPVFGYRFAEGALPPLSQQLAVAWRPHFETCVALFGAHRCMFESKFPVDKGMFSYVVLWNAFKRLALQASADKRAALFSGTVTSTYRLSRTGDAS